MTVDGTPFSPMQLFWHWTLNATNGRFSVSDTTALHPVANALNDLQAILATCGKPCHSGYNPSVDIQRYCESCRMWYHVACVSAADSRPSPIWLGLVNVSEHLQPNLLIIAMYQIEHGSALGAVGNGKVQLRTRWLLHEWKDDGIENWEQLIGPQYIAAMLKQEPVYFCCMRCDSFV